MNKLTIILIIHFIIITNISNAQDIETAGNNCCESTIKKWNLQLSLSGPFLINAGFTYKFIDNYGFAFSFIPTNYVFKGYFKTGVFYTLIERFEPEKPVNFTLLAGLNTAIVDYPHIISKYTGRYYWLEGEATFDFQSGINLFIRNGLGYIYDNNTKKLVGPLFLIPEIGVGYKF